jgi:hypothetical protein
MNKLSIPLYDAKRIVALFNRLVENENPTVMSKTSVPELIDILGIEKNEARFMRKLITAFLSSSDRY